ncbi:hypothetical protein [Myxococcus qinghaiensis]|nr:hypothetical protein [Myxococcus qinghaiensis]
MFALMWKLSTQAPTYRVNTPCSAPGSKSAVGAFVAFQSWLMPTS